MGRGALVVFLSATALASDAGAQLSTWEMRAAMPLPRAFAAAAAVDGQVYVLGGFDKAGEPTATVQIYDTQADSWSLGAELDAPKVGAGACGLHGKVYLVGGGDGDWSMTHGQALSSVMVYDPATASWTVAADLHVARYGLAVGVADGEIYAVGGTTSHSVNDFVDAAEIYDPETDAWRPAAELPHKDEFMSGTGLGGKVYVWGTKGGNLFEYDPQRDDWDQYSCPFPLTQASAVAGAGDWVYVLGGWGSKATKIFDAVRGTWDEGPEMPAPRALMSAVHVNGTIYALGGGGDNLTSSSPDPTSTVWAYQVYEPTAIRMQTWGGLKSQQSP